MATLDFSDKIAEASSNINNIEEMLGKGLLQPFNGSNAGARKIMHGTHRDHVFPLISGEKAIIETGYEIKFGDYEAITDNEIGIKDVKVTCERNKETNNYEHCWRVSDYMGVCWSADEDLEDEIIDLDN